MQEAAGFHRSPEFSIVDGHEIDQLARTGQAETFHCQNTSSLRQCFDNQHARHDWPSGKMPLEKALIDCDGFDRADSLVDDKLLYAVNQEHGVAVRKHRHDPADVIIAEICPRHRV